MKIQLSFLSLATALSVLFLLAVSHSSDLDIHPNQLSLSFFSGDTPVNFIVVEKSSQRLMVFEQQQSLKLLKTFVCATGENPGRKSVSGDAKTPEGLYFITEVYEDKKITVFGSRAFHLDYPNVFDKHAGYLGDGIFIHGTNKQLIPYSTNGCITLDNKDLDELASYLTVDAIPIIILETLTEPLLGTNLKINKDDSRFKKILHKLSPTLADYSIENVDALSFLALGSQAIASINYRVFDENSSEYRYQKRVYLTATALADWRTLYAVESQQAVPTLLAMHPVKMQSAKQPTPPEAVAAQANTGNELLEFVKKWQTAWSAKDIDTYIECYSPSFRNGRLDRRGWKNRKSYLNKKYDFIKVAIRNIAIERTNTGANVSFFQEYQSDQYQTSGNKLLQLVNRDNKWMIQKEIM